MIIVWAIVAFVVWWVVSFVFNCIESYIEIRRFQKISDDWIFPIHVEYTPDKQTYYAWDIDDVFLGQSNNFDNLLTEICKRWKIPNDKIVIKSEKEFV